MVKVKLFGLLPRYVTGYDPAQGVDIDVQKGTLYRDLAAILHLPPGEASLFTVSGILKLSGDVVSDGEEVSIFTLLSGG